MYLKYSEIGVCICQVIPNFVDCLLTCVSGVDARKSTMHKAVFELAPLFMSLIFGVCT